MLTIEDQIKSTIRSIPDFPKPGIDFKDITPILQHPDLCEAIATALYENTKALEIDCVAAAESRGFLFGLMIAQKLNVPFVPIRKKGKLPYKTFSQSYESEYRHATIEIHQDAVKKGSRVMLHDDLLATGGTMEAAARLIRKAGGEVVSFSFLIELSFLHGYRHLTPFTNNILSLAKY